MYRRLSVPTHPVTFTFEGRLIEAQRGDTVAAALLAANAGPLRETPVSGAARAPYCMMGACFDCLVKVDGAPNRQACMTLVTEGMVVEKQDGAA